MTQYQPPHINRKLNVQAWWLTALLISINVGLFIWQIVSGVDISDPAIKDALRWGADFTPLTFSGQPERLFTSMFFHFGIIHLMLNMWALYIFGNVAEALFGRLYFIGLYLLAGLFGSLLSSYINIQNGHELLQHFDQSLLPHVSAGASGAVMGLGAALTVLSLFPPLPHQAYILDKKALLMIMAINLIFGFVATGINNAAHVGGMIMGALLAFIWYLSYRTQFKSLLKFLGLVGGLFMTVGFYVYCNQLNSPLLPLWHEVLIQNPEILP
ncbi:MULTISPECIES: rhomboid family intramembrane serine protease [Acinetobacter]|uniref:Rhomboid family intramembrane serine protease n=1 Tax=Acinetobacter baumannii TaxID=470 RepID=A0A0M3FME0_ACIBA|nr:MULTISPECIES: rhomboid family intramembrane serine protease [Acinetobacter]EXG36166.1 rhomboid family protein [Acinetobacter baumannii 121738]CAH1085214.1 rhomboid family protein [Acinetobacter phage MD-2021a]ARG35966.1 rhomboid family intramembrane serine protease [Acinetobacter baumannii]ASO72155.1 rhomboid family intramembrane serine protease [Acinetobacter baumannii]ATI37981.1 rhomboid family intramembrane serine protease [Acinetobacter baumannii]